MPKKTLSTLTKIITFCLPVIFLSSCSTGAKMDKSKLSDIQSVAVVSVGFNRQVQSFDNINPLAQLQQLGKVVGIYPKPTEEEKAFYDTFTNEAIDVLITTTPFTVTLPTPPLDKDYIANTTPPKSNPYVPAPYRYIKKLNSKTAKALCKALNTDAVMTVAYELRESTRQLAMKKETYSSLRGTFKILNKHGELVLEATSESDTIKLADGIVFRGVQFDKENETRYSEIAESYLANFQADLQSATSLIEE